MSEWVPRQSDRPKSLGRDTLPEDAFGAGLTHHLFSYSPLSFSSFTSLSLGGVFRAQGALSQSLACQALALGNAHTRAL